MFAFFHFSIPIWLLVSAPPCDTTWSPWRSQHLACGRTRTVRGHWFPNAVSLSHPRKSHNNGGKKDNLFSFLLIPGVQERYLGLWEITQWLRNWPWGFPISKIFFSSWRLGVLQGDFQSQNVGVGCPGISSVVTQCGCQIQVIRAVSDSVTNNFLGFPNEILLPSFHSSSCSSYAAYSWGPMFCCISSSNIEILFGGLEKKKVIQKNMAMKQSEEKQYLCSSNGLTEVI